VEVNTGLIEFLIPLTIFITCLLNVFSKSDIAHQQNYLKYALTLFFGLIHGLGFSNFLRALLGQEDSLILPLFAFNVGLEVGQIFIVAIVLLLSFIAIEMLKVARRDWTLVLSGAILGISLLMILERNNF
jgi:hypothetical protein